MLHDGRDYRLFLRRRDDPRTLYQAAWVAGTPSYRFGHRSIDTIPAVDFPADADPSLWSTFHDGAAYHLCISNHSAPGQLYQLYQATYDDETHAYRHIEAESLSLEGGPTDLHGLAMLHDGTTSHAYRLHSRQR